MDPAGAAPTESSRVANLAQDIHITSFYIVSTTQIYIMY